MSDEASCVECQGEMSPVVVMDKDRWGNTGPGPQAIEYRRPEDSRSFWTGKYPTAGLVRAFMCGSCGRISLYGNAPDAYPDAAPDPRGTMA